MIESERFADFDDEITLIADDCEKARDLAKKVCNRNATVILS